MAVQYYTDGSNVFIKSNDKELSHSADNVPKGAKLITEAEAEIILQSNQDKIKKYQEDTLIQLEQYRKDRYERLIRNGWNKADALVESGLEK